jgi:SAM-dependent methyltransferase
LTPECKLYWFVLSNLEHAEEFMLQGWAMHPASRDVTVSVDIHINGLFTARIPAETYRSDLDSTYGSGHHAFFFNPFDYLSSRSNRIEVRESSSGTLIAGGSRIVVPKFSRNGEAYRAASERSLQQWMANDPKPAHAQAEWEFLERLQRAVHFHPGLRILEVGSGQGHLLNLLIKRKKLFSSYLGLDLSRSHVESLRQRFGGDRVQLLTADATRYPFPGRFDLVIASSVCDALYPSCLPLLQNVCGALTAGGLIAFDLVVQDDRNSISRAEWQGDKWLRLYSQREIRRLLTEAGLELLSLEIYAKTANQHRVFLIAVKLHPRPHNNFGTS